MKKQFKLLKGDNMETLKQIPDNSIDSIVTDPPYGLSFMNKKWDYDVPSVEFWQEVYRVLKPGGHILSFGGTRTAHRMIVNIEDAGFEIRDMIMWIYGSGFPKSHNIGKAVDKIEGNKREVVGIKENWHSLKGGQERFYIDERTDLEVTKGSSPYEGYGTSLKPAVEPICVARKPISEKTVAANMLKWGTGGINIDGCRIEGAYGDGENKVIEGKKPGQYNNYDQRAENSTAESPIGYKQKIQVSNPEGRFPANIIFECICDEVIKGDKGEIVKRVENTNGSSFGSGTNKTDYNDTADIHTNPNCPCFQLDEQSGVSKGDNPDRKPRKGGHRDEYVGGKETKNVVVSDKVFSDKGGASRYFLNVKTTNIEKNENNSRFFYVAKVSKKERNLGLDGIILQLSNFMMKIDYNTKKAELWESQDQKVAHQEVMEVLTQKGIEEYKLKEMMVNTITKWNTELSGKVSTDPYQMVSTFTTLMVTNLITELKILNVLIEQNIKENILECILKTDFGTNIVANVMSGNQKNIIIEQKKDGCQDNASNVELKSPLKIKLKDETNFHSTLKPIKLMSYLIRLVTPENGVVLDPFMGSGSTGIAAMLEGKRFVGCELDEEYFKIAEKRIEEWEQYKQIIK